MAHLKVRSDEPEHGWISLLIHVNKETHQYNCSYAGLRGEAFSQLTRALLALRDQRGDYEVEWFYNPDHLRLVFSGEDEGIELVAQHVEEPFRAPREVVEWFRVQGTYDEICLPFWRALRNLEGRYSPDELAGRWKGYFPHRELVLLTKQLGKK